MKTTSSENERQERLREFSPAFDGQGTVALMAEIDRRREADPHLSYGDAFVAVAREHPEIAALYDAESRGAKPLPGHRRPVSDAVWTEVNRLYDALPEALRHGVLPPSVCQHWLSRWQPVYYLDDTSHLIGRSGDLRLGTQFGVTDRQPRYAQAPVLRLAVNLECATEEILQAVEAILRQRDPATRRRARYRPEDIGRMVRWYYRRHAGVPLKVLAAEEATQRRTRRTAAPPESAAAVRQAEKRIRAGLQWFERQFPARRAPGHGDAAPPV